MLFTQTFSVSTEAWCPLSPFFLFSLVCVSVPLFSPPCCSLNWDFLQQILDTAGFSRESISVSFSNYPICPLLLLLSLSLTHHFSELVRVFFRLLVCLSIMLCLKVKWVFNFSVQSFFLYSTLPLWLCWMFARHSNERFK